MQRPWPGLKPAPLDQESSTQIIRPPRPPQRGVDARFCQIVECYSMPIWKVFTLGWGILLLFFLGLVFLHWKMRLIFLASLGWVGKINILGMWRAEEFEPTAPSRTPHQKCPLYPTPALPQYKLNKAGYLFALFLPKISAIRVFSTKSFITLLIWVNCGSFLKEKSP